MYHSITFGTKNTWDDWHLIPTSRPVFNPPSVKTNLIEIPGGDGALDLTTALAGRPLYKNRTGSIEFYVDNDFRDWTVLYSEIMVYLHGQKMRAVLEDDPSYFYEGRFAVNAWKSNKDRSSLVIDYDVNPYKKDILGTDEEWIWDTFNFETGIVRYYAENLMRLVAPKKLSCSGINPSGHNFRAYAKNWFVTYSNPNIERATAQTYQRQLTCYIFPAIGDMDIEDVTTDHIQTLFNGMNVAKASKDKTRMVLNMIFEMALDEGIIAKNPMKSKRLRITGRASEPTEEYSIEQMQYLIGHISDVKNDTDRAYLALQALHPLRLEEVLGLKWADIDREHMQLHICRAVTHPTRNMPEIKVPKTKASVRSVGLSKLALDILGEGDQDEFVIGSEKPFSYTQVRRMCERIRRDTGFEDKITPIRFRTTVLTDIYDQTKDIKQAQAAAGHTTATMTLKYYVKGRSGMHEATSAVERAYGVG